MRTANTTLKSTEMPFVSLTRIHKLNSITNKLTMTGLHTSAL
jgi:hypothetical protein